MDASQIPAMLENPEAYGFTFLTETVKKDGRSSGPVPLIKIVDVPLFEENFPGVILKTEDGSSIRVHSQGVSRDGWFGGDKDVKSLKTRLLRWLLGIEQVQAKFVAADGKAYATQEEAQKASEDWALAQVK